jgi:hypothetical protein
MLISPIFGAKSCVEFKSSRTCAPWNQAGLQLDLESLARAYGWSEYDRGRPFSLGDWETAVQDTTGGGNSQVFFTIFTLRRNC